VRKILGNNFLPLYHVTYDDNRPIPYNIIKGDRNMIYDFIYTKGKCWEYEEEYRIILNDDILLKNPLCIEENEIREVIFGLKTSDKLKEQVVNIINTLPNNGKDITIYEMIKKEKQYKLERKKIR
jgi:CRISPR/Cas system-associated protein Cas10 (large subunit of type III CRISPR-Cas system)